MSICLTVRSLVWHVSIIASISLFPCIARADEDLGMEALRTGALVLKATNETAVGSLGAGAVERLSGHIEFNDAKAKIANGEPAVPVAGGLVARIGANAAMMPVAEVAVRVACVGATDGVGAMAGCGFVAAAAEHTLTKAADFTQNTTENFLKNLDEGSSLTAKNAGEPGWANANAAFADDKPSLNGGASGIVQYNFGGDGTEGQLAGMQKVMDAMKDAVQEASKSSPDDASGDTNTGCMSGAPYSSGGCVSADGNEAMEQFSDDSGPTLEDMLNSAAQQQQYPTGGCSPGAPRVDTPNPTPCY
ncbi:hypothetical protein [Mesorhizobium sp. CO1-1-4]|uniref:hypothetical protein n=1 Tax=Mesorhizobium sp. CO1-1-4 TaxID=2876633 RepID=UPI001CCDC349|nr:hypothetical protein [Mesorhizobium sp. CO1-1-4]MBZ9740615.1 hypothetical protein [Mesorhizobium sp. CO1-1-4]